MEKYLIQSASLEKFFNGLIAQGKTMIAPRLVNGKLSYGNVTGFGEVATDFIQTVQSAKEVLFPRYEKLFDYRKDKVEIVLRDFNPEDVPEMIIWGIRPCDAQGFLPLDAIMNWDSGDKMFNSRRAKTTVISFSCQRADEYCFCNSVGGSPGSTEGSDIQFTRVEDGNYLVEVITEKGQLILKLMPELFQQPENEIQKERYIANLPVRFERQKITRKLASFFDSEVWIEQSLRCLGCGACAFVCPSCACFDIQDEAHGKNGSRLRCWDSCGFSLFTQHTSGHNPREKQSQRWRQRLLHKFSYMPERLSVYGCTGCGRCSRACPVDMNILEHLLSMQEVDHE
jgi:sulfhydrogenase subunit beta (sulfur reductase)